MAALSSGLSFFQVVAKLDYYVRVAALETLGKLDAAALAPHVAAIVAIVAKLEHSENYVRVAALETLGKLDAAALAHALLWCVHVLGNVEASILTLRRGVSCVPSAA